jgi:hypothetical protein
LRALESRAVGAYLSPYMASRFPRRIFSSPFVLTLAVPACVVSSSPAPSQQTTRPPQATPQQTTPPPTTTAPTTPSEQKPPLVVENPPRPQPDPATPPTRPDGPRQVAPQPVRPTTPPVVPTRPDGPRQVESPPKAQPAVATKDRHWVVANTANVCKASDTDVCRAKPAPRNGTTPSCTTPMTAYKCPDGLASGATLNIIQYAGQDTCFVVMPSPQCPPKVACNPPPPRKIICP